MGNKKINELTPQTTIASADKIPFWKESGGVTSYIQYSALLSAVSDSLLVGEEGSSTSKAMTQKAVTDKFTSILSTVDYVNNLLIDSEEVTSYDWEARKTYATDTTETIDGENRTLKSVFGVEVLNWSTFLIKDNSGVIGYDIINRLIYDGYGSQSFDGNNRLLKNASGYPSINFNACVFYDSGIIESGNWSGRYFNDTTGIVSFNYGSRSLKNSSGINLYDWENNLIYGDEGFVSFDPTLRAIKYGSTLIVDAGNAVLYYGGVARFNWQYSAIYDGSSMLSVDWNIRRMYESDGATYSLDWEVKTLYGNWIASGTGAFQVPVGTTGERPTAAAGQIRLNTTTSKFEGYDGSGWVDLN